MIIQDKKKYLDYIKKTEEKVNNLYESINSNSVLGTTRKDIDSIRSKIFGKIVVINLKLDANQIITQPDWEQYTKQIDELYKKMSDKVNQTIARSPHTKANER